jgi:alginate biosynthesis protein AlgX
MAGALFFLVSAAQADEMTQSVLYGYKTFLQYHPPKDQPVKHSLYPFPGPIIRFGEDIPVCAAARTAGAYARKTELRYMLHGINGWLFRSADFRTDFSATPQTLAYFGRLNKVLASKGETLVIAFQPPRGMLEEKYVDPADKPKGYSAEKAKAGYKAFLHQLDELDIDTVDLSNVPQGLGFFPKADFHWTPEGAAFSAEQIADDLRDLPAYKNIEKHEYDTVQAGMGPADRGAFEEFIQNVCRVNIELTTEPLWDVTEKGRAADAASLLGDASFPALTVLGTSNSSENDKFNFVNSLKKFSGIDAYNAALTGGGFGASSYRYYASDEYHQHPPKIIVWEFLPQHNYNNEESQNAFRQMIPAIYGACDEKTAQAHYSGEISREQTTIFTDIRDLPLHNSYIYLEALEPAERKIKLEVLYKNGNIDQVDLTRSTRADNNGKYYYELGKGANSNALLFHVITDTPKGKLNARICPYPVHIAEK